ncbi:uncharacterized protein H6S33_007611 [Morchella sextelata]|uniref:uncharacterized protein n=1 Tax=Morchella sextelata TaxID=1174677 RepID=UPI001D048455|nr:uncharacterized protein H6S33_007611 [Morchella sextelata]KAH0603289.1 hypothetical protein H6S33_007611 [Morchella sextelata]
MENHLRPGVAILTNSANGTPLALSHNVLINVADDGNVVLKPRDQSDEQLLWTLEDGKDVSSGVVEGRLQSVARRDLYMAVAGHVPMPPIMFNVSAIAKDGNAERFKWRVEYK